MVSLDLDIISKKSNTIKLGGKQHAIKNLTVAEHLNNEVLAGEIDAMPLNRETVEEASKKIVEYILNVFEISEEEAAKLSLEQYKAIRRFLQRKDLYDQGFNDKDIDLMEKKAIKKQMAQIK